MNPLFQAGSAPNNATAPTNKLNDAAPAVRHTFNRFNNGYKHYTSANYGEYTPFFNQICNPADSKKFKSVSQVRTLSLKSPLYSQVKMNKDYFFVPYDAILPHSWQKIYRNPSQGDDVPADANTVIPDVKVLFQFATTFVDKVKQFLDSSIEINDSMLAPLGRFIYLSFPLMDAFFSSGGLLSRLGYNNNHSVVFQIGTTFYPSWDRCAEALYPLLFPEGANMPFNFPSGGVGYSLTISNESNFIVNDSYPEIMSISGRDALSFMRYFPDNIIVNVAAFVAFLKQVRSKSIDFKQFIVTSFLSDSALEPKNLVFNYDQCVAYNLCCAQFYTNGNVDSVYNAELYRDALGSYVKMFNDAFDTYSYNGINVLYDVASGHYMSIAFAKVTSDTSTPDAYVAALCYLRNIFCIQNSLKYGDYFTGSHTRPLAVGDVTAPVVGEQVSAVDMTKAIAYQRFLNVVVKLKNSFADYLRSLFGSLPAPDYHEAKFVSHSEGSVDGFEVANTTGSDQGNLVTLLHSVKENFEFELQVDMPGISLGIVSFVASRAYCQTRDRMFMREDRYDMFNPMLQTIGDQPIYGMEKSPLYTTPYGYVQRYMEYKQRYNVASGAFDDVLRTYCIICDSPHASSNALELLSPNVNPVSIRLTPRELDRFFTSVAWSYGNSFHFICEFDNQCDDVREADYAPSIL